MVGNYNLFPIGSTGFGENNPIKPIMDSKQPTTKKSWCDGYSWCEKIPDIIPSMPKIPGTETIKDVYGFFGKLSDATTWQRGGMIVIGLIFLLVGLYLLGNKPATVVIDRVRSAAS